MVEIYHNPRCGKSREALKLLQEQNVEYEIIEYLKKEIQIEEMQKILAQLGMTAEQLLRKNEDYYKKNLKGVDLTEDQLIAEMISNPKLIERPIVIANDKAVVARPAEKLLEIL